jgi:hypothetical protein
VTLPDDRQASSSRPPYATGLFVAVCWLVVANTICKYPANTLLGMGILALGPAVYAFWAGRKKGLE